MMTAMLLEWLTHYDCRVINAMSIYRYRAKQDDNVDAAMWMRNNDDIDG